jgi:hypothetical protein
MPRALEEQLKRQALKRIKQKGKAGRERREAYVWGTMQKLEAQHRAKGGKAGKYYSRSVGRYGKLANRLKGQK